MPCARFRLKPMLHSESLRLYAQTLPPGPQRDNQIKMADSIVGTVEDHMTSESSGFMCGKDLIACRDCGTVADYLCDMPIAPGKTCDAPLCEDCAHVVGDDKHLCPFHWGEGGSSWDQERKRFLRVRQQMLSGGHSFFRERDA